MAKAKIIDAGVADVQTALERFIVERPKASLRSMKLIISTFDGLPTKIVDDDGTLEFETLGKLIAIGVQQIDRGVTQEQVEDAVTMDNIQEAIQAATNFMTMTIPEGVIPPEMREEEPGDETGKN